jgi:methyl-accepting chemotaxis protein
VAALGRIIELQRQIGGETQRAVATAMQMSRVLLAGLFVLAVVIGVGVAWAVARIVVRPLKQVVAILRDLAEAEGDLTKRLESTSRDEVGELGRWFNSFMAKFLDIMRPIKESSQQVTSASHQLAAASEQLSSGTQEQASSLEETAASLEQITGTVKQTADNARQANQLALDSRDTARRGGQALIAVSPPLAEQRVSARVSQPTEMVPSRSTWQPRAWIGKTPSPAKRPTPEDGFDEF